VAAIVNLYVPTLVRLKTVLGETPLPVSARSAAASAHALAARDVQFLGTINGLPPLKLGTYLVELGTNAIQLQTTLHHLQRQLPASQP
jgi:hypothetical protein